MVAHPLRDTRTSGSCSAPVDLFRAGPRPRATDRAVRRMIGCTAHGKPCPLESERCLTGVDVGKLLLGTSRTFQVAYRAPVRRRQVTGLHVGPSRDRSLDPPRDHTFEISISSLKLHLLCPGRVGVEVQLVNCHYGCHVPRLVLQSTAPTMAVDKQHSRCTVA